MTTELTKAAPNNHGPIHETDLYDFAGWLTTRPGVMAVGSSCEAGPMAEAVGEYIKTFPERFALTQRPAAQTEREAWVPYLVDRADGVKGHYAIGRWNPRGYREVWNLHSHRWAAYSDDVMSLEEADSLLRQITIPTVRASLPATQQATPASAPQSLLMRLAGIAAECSDPDTTDALDALIAATQQATPEPVGEPIEGEFFAFDPEGGNAFYKTRQEAINHAKESLRYYQDGAKDHGEWDEDVEHVRWGVVMQRAKATNISATEDGESSCDYELQDVATRPTPVETEPVGETWGWAIEDKHGVAQAIRPARKEFFGCVQSSEPFTAEDVSKMDCEWAGLAPHRIVTLFTHPAPGVPEGWRVFRTHDGIDVHTPDGSACYVEAKATADRRIPEEVLHALCSSLLAAAQAKGGEQ